MDRSKSAERQVAIVGILAFCGPGLFNALNGLGGAGSDSATVAALANGSLYCTFAISGYFAGAAFNLVGPVPLFVIGGITYSIYAACIYFTSYYEWLAILGGAALGVGAGLFWTAQGSLMMAYATPNTRGKLIALFWVLFNLGGVVGGLLEFAINYDSDSSAANPSSYFTFIGIMLCGAVLAPCVLADPAKVVKEDGSSVQFEKADSPGKEIVAAIMALKDPFVQRLLLYFAASNWFYTYDFSGFNGSQFNIRTRGLNSAIFWGAQMIASWLFSKVADDDSLKIRERAAKGLWIVVSTLVISLGPAIYDNFSGANGACPGNGGGDDDGDSSGGGWRPWDKTHSCELDFREDAPAVFFPMVIYALLGAADAVYQSYAYWIMSSAAGGSVRKTVQYSACYKGVQSLGAGVAWLSDLDGSFSYRAQGIVALALTVLACVPVATVIRELPEEPEKEPGSLYAPLSVNDQPSEGA